jgi:HK97 family phage portal protein
MSFIERIKSAFKSVPFPGSSGVSSNSPVVIYPDMNAWQDAILRAITAENQPSSDPHLSSLVAAGVTWLANTLPEPDIQVKKEFLRKRSGKQRDDNVIERHPLYELFDRPNPYTSGSTLWKAFAYSWIIAGNVYFIKLRNAFGQVVELWYEPHFTICPRWVNDKNGEYLMGDVSQSVPSIPRNDSPTAFINYYEVNRDGQYFRIEPRDVIHFKDGISPYNTRLGQSRLATILREIYGDSAAASYASSLLAGNGVIPYVLAIDDKEGLIGEADLANIKAKMLAQTTGANAGKPIVVTSRATVQKTGLTPEELDIRTARYMSQETFSAVTGIPAIVLNFGAGMERTIYNNMEQADRRAVDQYLQPLWWHIAQELTHQLLRDLDTDESHFVEFDLSEVGALQEDQNEKATRVIAMYQGQVIKRSEARMALDYEVDPGGADDVYLVKAGTETVDLEQEKIQREASIEATQNPPEPPQLGDGQMNPQMQRPQLVAKSLGVSNAEIREHWERHAPERVKGLISAKGR